MKIAICMPCHGSPKLETTFCLTNLVIATAKALPEAEIRPFFASSSSIADLRRKLMLDALIAGCGHILWIDSDQTFPADGLLRLLAHNVAAVGCNYVGRSWPHRPVAAIEQSGKNAPVFTDEGKAAGPLEEVSFTGLGFFLFRTALIGAMKPPYFDMPYDALRGSSVGEDQFFCASIRAAGEKVLVDHSLSLQIGHIGEATFDYRHAVRKS